MRNCCRSSKTYGFVVLHVSKSLSSCTGRRSMLLQSLLHHTGWDLCQIPPCLHCTAPTPSASQMRGLSPSIDASSTCTTPLTAVAVVTSSPAWHTCPCQGARMPPHVSRVDEADVHQKPVCQAQNQSHGGITSHTHLLKVKTSTCGGCCTHSCCRVHRPRHAKGAHFSAKTSGQPAAMGQAPGGALWTAVWASQGIHPGQLGCCCGS